MGSFMRLSTTTDPHVLPLLLLVVVLLVLLSAVVFASASRWPWNAPLYTCCPDQVKAILFFVSILPEVHCRSEVASGLRFTQVWGVAEYTGLMRSTPSSRGYCG
jgi:hypothetical protein